MMTGEEAAAVVRKYTVNHSGEFVSPAIYRAADVLLAERDRYRREAEGRREFTDRLAATIRKVNGRLRGYQLAYLRCRRQYQVLNRLHREAMQRLEREGAT